MIEVDVAPVAPPPPPPPPTHTHTHTHPGAGATPLSAEFWLMALAAWAHLFETNGVVSQHFVKFS